MAKKRLPDDRMDKFLSRPKILSEHIKNLERTRSEHIENTRFEQYKKTELETFSIRLTPEDKQKLRDYFSRRSVPLSQGIRMIIKEFMEKNI